MLVMLTDNQVIRPDTVCQNCLMADSGGHPRWKQGRLCCGHAVPKSGDKQPNQYECEMGFRLVNID
jgi:hypothetical protein